MSDSSSPLFLGIYSVVAVRAVNENFHAKFGSGASCGQKNMEMLLAMLFAMCVENVPNLNLEHACWVKMET
jgi:hypothetical protein